MMRYIVYSIICIVLLTAIAAADKAKSLPKTDIVFEGTVVQMAPPVPVSGMVFSYRLVKYRVERVCKGHFSGTEMIVDHQILAGTELDGVKIGDRVCVAVTKSKSVAKRWDVEGIRSPSDIIKLFYIGGGVAKAQTSSCSCLEEAIKNISFYNLKRRQ
jgi:ribosomal protein S17